MKHYDLIIIGGGMVGAGLAAALQDTHLKIALIDATPLHGHDDPRLIALNYGSHCFFKNLNVWPSMALHATAIEQIHVSEQGRFGVTRLTAAEVQLDALGYVVPAKYINAALNDSLADTQHVDILRPALLKQITQETDYATVTIQTAAGEQTLASNIVIGADGSHSTVRKLLDLPTETVDYHQSALVTIIQLNRHHDHLAYERFHSSGAIAMLPLVGNQCATIWTDTHEKIDELSQQSPEEFLQILQTEFGYRLGRLTNVGKRFVFPLQLIRARQTKQQHVLLVGNAAHTLHPIAAQGLNLALHDVACLAQKISKQVKTHQPLRLQDLDIEISAQQQHSLTLSHRLTWLFSTDFFMVNLARQLGMIGLDIFPSAKVKFIEQAIGRTGKTPELFLEKDTDEYGSTS